MQRFFLLIILFVISGVPQSARAQHIKNLPFSEEIIYLSSDLAHVAVFSKKKTRFGPTDLTIVNPEWPSSPASYFETNNGMRCLSIGIGKTSSQYAIKRPIKLHEEYKCARTLFRVTKCFDDCRAAIIEIDRPMSGDSGGTYKAYMYVDSCRGVIVLAEVSNLAEGIPLNAEWLRGEVGILAHPKYPRCRSF